MTFLALFIAFFLQALPELQSEEYLVTNYTVQDGLPVNTVNRILQDENGYLWFSTLDGLVRYDGYNFRVYNSGNTKGMTSNRIAGMIKTDSNEIWMIQAEGIIIRKSGSTFKTFSSSNGDFKGEAIRIIQAKNGQIWISTSQGMALFNDELQTFESLDHPNLQANTWAIESTFDGGILAINNRGIYHWRDENATLLIPVDEFPIPPGEVIQIKQFKPGEFWVMGARGLFRYSLTEQNIDFIYSPQDEPFAVGNLHSEPDGTFIINSSTGFYSLDPNAEQVLEMQPQFRADWERINLVFRGSNNEEIYLTNNEVFIDGHKILDTAEIQSGMIDREGSLWITTLRDGVFQIRRSDFSNITASRIPGFENIYPIIQSPDDEIWTGSFVNGIYRISGDAITNWNEGNSNLPSNLCRFLFADYDGSIYAGIWARGLWRYHENNWQEEHRFADLFEGETTVEAMHRDQEGRLFIGNSGRLVYRQNDTYSFFDDSDNPAFRGVRVIRESSDGILFLGTNGNGFTVIKDSETLHYTRENSELSSNAIRDIYVQSPDTLWLTTENLGLNRIVLNGDQSTSVTSITEQDGLIKNSLHRIIETPDNHLWISSNGGIMRSSLSDLNRFADRQISNLPIVTFNERNGMINREANGGVQTAGLLTDDHKLWFPNQKGITIIDPLRISEGSHFPVPNVVIDEAVLSDSTYFINHRSEIEIAPGERNLRLTFSAPNFSNPDRIQFQYKLEGVNQNWESGDLSREAVLTNIPPGPHEFQVRAYRTGSPEVSEASLIIHIPYYFYETIWFYGLMGLTGLLLIFGGIKYRTHVLEQREKHLQERVHMQTDALKKAADQKSRFFSGITHELKTPLSLILGPLDDMLNEEKPHQWQNAESRMKMMRRNGYRLKYLVDQILEVSKLNAEALKLCLQPVALEALTRQIAGQFYSRLEQENLKLTIATEPISTPIYVDREAWERILINLISNAIKFSPANSSITISLHDLPDEVEVCIKDEGKGIAPEHQRKVFDYLYQVEGQQAAEGTGIGLYLVKGLVEHMGGTIRLLSEEGWGAKFIIRLKKGHAHFRDTDTVDHEIWGEDTEKITQTEPLPKTPEKTEEASSASKDMPTVLVVEDNSDFRTYLNTILEKHYQVLMAEEGNKALEMLEFQTPDLIISDVMMPGMDGLEFVNNLRRKKEFLHLPVIFLSAKNQETDVETGLSTGADIYLTKPIRSKMLLAQIAAVLRREKVLQSGQFKNKEEQEAPLVLKIRELVYRQLANPFLNVNMIADTLYMSRTKLYGEWKKVSDISLNDYIKQLRMEEAKVLLSESQFSVQETARAVGYTDPNYFSTSFKKEFGHPPSEIN